MSHRLGSPEGDLNHSVSTEDLDQLNDALVADEVHMVKGVLELRDQKSLAHMTPISDVHMLDMDGILDEDELAKLIGCGHSRVPVYSGDHYNIKGIILVKRLIAVNPADRRPVATMQDIWKEPLFISGDLDLQALLNVFQKTKQHLAVVCASTKQSNRCRAKHQTGQDMDPDDVLGIITCEDVIENLIQEEIYDETDGGHNSVKVKLAEAFTLQRRLPALRRLVSKERNLRKLDKQGTTFFKASKRLQTPRGDNLGHSTMDGACDPNVTLMNTDDGYVSVEMK